LCARVIGSGTTLSGMVPMASNRVVMLNQVHCLVSPMLPGQNCSELEGIRRMWERGPLRQFSETQAKSHYVAYSGPFLTGYAGSYICDQCHGPCAGVYFVKETRNWLCGGCKEKLRRSGRRQ
jgi:hypothetical protein